MLPNNQCWAKRRSLNQPSFCTSTISSCLVLATTFILSGSGASVFAWSSPWGATETFTRRGMFQRVVTDAAIASTVSWLIDTRSSPAFAKNLPDPVVVDTSKTGTQETLEPILRLEASLKVLSRVIAKEYSPATIVETLAKSAIPTQEKVFKSIFDAYSDPVSYKQKFVDQNAFLVYYTQGFDGPGRPSI